MSRHALGIASTLALAQAALAQPCTLEISDRFPSADLNGDVQSLAVFTDSQGPALYAGGAFLTAGGKPVGRIARWRGQAWEALAAGFNNTVNAVTVFDDGAGGGPAVYAAGAFTGSGATPIQRIARWNGTSWVQVGGGLAAQVKSLAIFDEDGAGPNPPRLFAGGDFTSLGGSGVNSALRLARWDGVSWSAVSGGCDGPVETLAIHNDGAGDALYIGGSFTTAGGATVNRIAKYNGATFSALGSGAAGAITALGTHDPDGAGGAPAQLIAGGDFTSIGGIGASRIARWDGTQWLAMGDGLDGGVRRIAEYNDGRGRLLWVAGTFANAGGAPAGRIALWDGQNWSTVSDNAFLSPANDFIPFNDGRGQRLFVGGAFASASGVSANRIATWDGQDWSGLHRGPDQSVEALVEHGGSVYLAGTFERVDAIASPTLARFDGISFFPITGNVPAGDINAMASFDDGSGPSLFIAGGFTTAGSLTANRIVRYKDNTFTPIMAGISNGVNNTIHAMIVWNGSLYITGTFTAAGITPASRIARWDGQGWTALGAGLNSPGSAMAVFNDGTGEALYVGGSFTAAGGITANRLARWDGQQWSAVGDGLNANVNALAVYNDGSPRLYVGGSFLSAGGQSASRIARWDGSSWSAVGSGVNNTVTSLAVHDGDGPGGAGPELIVGGSFSAAGAVTATRLARWNGSAWSALGSAGAEGADNTVLALASVASANARGLYIGGTFNAVGGVSSSRFARWECQQGLCYANCDESVAAPILNVADFTCFLQRFAAGQPYANCDASTAQPVLNVADFTCFLQRFAAGCH